MNAATLVRTFGLFLLAFPPSSHASKTAVGQEHPKREHAVNLLREAATLVGQLPPAQRSPALNSLAEAWKPIAPAESREILADSFLATSSLTPDQRGEQQAEAVRRMAAIDVAAARELAGQIRPPAGAEYTMEPDWRAAAWDGLLQESLARRGLKKTIEQAKLSQGLADTLALSLLVRASMHQDPQAARDLAVQAAQQFSMRPITIRRFSTFPKALLLLAEVDRPMARLMFARLFEYVPERPSTSDADTESGKQRIVFIRDATGLLLRRAKRLDPLLAQKWAPQFASSQLSNEADAENLSPSERPTDTQEAMNVNAQTSSNEDRNLPFEKRVQAGLSAIQNQDLQAQTTLRLAQKFSRKNLQMANDLLGAARTEASTISDPSLRAGIYANAARAEDLLHDPHVSDDLETADSALSLAQRAAKDEDVRNRLTVAEMNVMHLIIQKLDLESAELRAQQFTNPVVRFRALILVAQRWDSTEPQNKLHQPLNSER